ncbi:MAG: tRNA pseudouridine(54/55) synthase Pus10 [Planctomycetota bacterium]|nr:MAG: tRNA pseudouridine(54/55) synthase Pus10 [Planctomycetota bacterium]
MSDLPPVDELAPRVVERCEEAVHAFAFDTFWVGVRIRPRAERSADVVAAWKGELKRRVGGELVRRWSGLGRAPDHQRPQMLMVYDLERDRVRRTVRSAYVYGRYRKLARGLPQTRAPWRCTSCRGGGCGQCEGTGRQYPTSVEDLLGEPLRAAYGAASHQLHGMGREDIDVRCLGAGRPFVLELRRPRRRSVDLAAVAEAIVRHASGRVELPAGLRAVDDESLVARLKGWEADKRYRALCSVGEAVVEPGQLAALEASLSGADIEQRTPRRVARRRADKVRRRRVRRFRCEDLEGNHFAAVIEAQSGTYIKELISGDEGRTRPSVSELLGSPCVCASLDVLAISVRDDELLALPSDSAAASADAHR